MNCKCGIRALFFEKTNLEGTFNVFKCDVQETKKKGKCDFYYSQKIKDPVKRLVDDTLQTIKKVVEVDPRETYIKDLNKYMRLLKNAAHLPKEYSTDYIANINYILKRLNMRFYFEDTESVECLEKRIKNNECIISQPDTPRITFPLKLTEYSPELRVPLKTKRKKIKKIKTKLEIVKFDFNSFIENDEFEKPVDEIEKRVDNIEKLVDEIDNKSVCSDNSSEISDVIDNDDNNTFDVDDYDSDVDESFDDTGAFSD